MRSESGCCRDTQQIVRSEKLVQTPKILFALLYRLWDASAVKLLHQLKTGCYFGTKLRLVVSDPRAQTTLNFRPLDHAKDVGPCREATSSVISNQLSQ